MYRTDQQHEAHTERVETFAESNDQIVLEDVHQDEDINNEREELQLGRASINRLCMVCHQIIFLEVNFNSFVFF